jgi:hypothetical protein
MVWRLVIGLALTLAAFALAGRRVWMLYRLGASAQPVEPEPHARYRAARARHRE